MISLQDNVSIQVGSPRPLVMLTFGNIFQSIDSLPSAVPQKVSEDIFQLFCPKL